MTSLSLLKGNYTELKENRIYKHRHVTDLENKTEAIKQGIVISPVGVF